MTVPPTFTVRNVLRYTAREFADWIAAEQRWRQVSAEERRKAA